MRILLAAEGESDEIIASSLISHFEPSANMECRVLPARGWPVVRRLTRSTIRAAYFGFYDILVLHFDCDDLRIDGEGSRRDEMLQTISDTLNSLPLINREKALRVVLCTPCQSSDAWLIWANKNGDGRSWERMNRHQIKKEIFGDPPRELRATAKQMMQQLLDRMASACHWPDMLLRFRDEIAAAADAFRPPGTQ